MTQAADTALLELLAASGAQTPSARAVCREIAVGRPSPALLFLVTQTQAVEGSKLDARSRIYAADESMHLEARVWHLLRGELATAARGFVGLDRGEIVDALAGDGLADLRASMVAHDMLAGIRDLSSTSATVYDRQTGAHRKFGAELAFSVGLLLAANLDDRYTARMLVKLASIHGVDLSSSQALLRSAGVDPRDEVFIEALAAAFVKVRAPRAVIGERRR